MNPSLSVILCTFFLSIIMICLKLLSCVISSILIVISTDFNCCNCCNCFDFLISVLDLIVMIICSLIIKVIVITNRFLLSVSLLSHVNSVIFLLTIPQSICVFINLFVSLLLSFVNVHFQILISMIVLIGIIIMM
jgi:hypothetical protein